MRVEPEAFAKYSWTDRQIKSHRAQIREAFGTRPAALFHDGAMTR